MVDLLSIHVPKTAGTSFYRLLQANYCDQLSVSLRREHIMDMQANKQAITDYLIPEISVVHGHITIAEAQPLILRDRPKTIAFLRDPVERVISNYCYFIDLLRHPEQQQQNPAVYALNKHRIHESIFEYAAMDENRNVMSQFLSGLPLADYFYLGLQSTYAADIKWLGKKLAWPVRKVQRHNVKTHLKAKYVKVDQGMRYYLRKLNAADEALFKEACAIRKQKGWDTKEIG